MTTATAPFFAAPETQEALRSELRSWQGTRFWSKSAGKAKKGVGADCVSFVEAVLVNMGAIKPIEWPQYLIRGGGPAMRDLMLQVLDDIPEIGRIWWPETGVNWQTVELLPGDVLVRSVRDDAHHMAIYQGDKTVWHALARYGVCTNSVSDTYAIQDMQAIYRVFK